jgi:hypothetical protein
MMACAFEMRIGPHVAAPIALYGLEGLDRCYEKLPDYPESGAFVRGTPTKPIWIHGTTADVLGYRIKVLNMGLTQNALAHYPACGHSSRVGCRRIELIVVV